MKSIKNTRANVLNKKLKYKEKQKTKGSFIFRKNKDNLILNKRQLVSIIRVDRDLFIDKTKIVYNNNIIAEQIL
jgi:hypothetical protein